MNLFRAMFWKPKPVAPPPAPEPVKLLKCRGCGHRYHPSMNCDEVMMGTRLTGHCPDCTGAT